MAKNKNSINVLAGHNLKYFMKKNNISVQELANSFGIESSSLLKILNGTNAISGPYNYILVNEYNCNLNFIYGALGEESTVIGSEEIFDKGEDSDKERLRAVIMRNLYYLNNLLELLE